MKSKNKGWKVFKFFFGAFLMALIAFVVLEWYHNGRLYGIEYTVNDDDSYTLSEYGLFNTEKTFIVPSIYNQKPVTKIGSDAFSFCGFRFKGVVIPDSVTTIDNFAFFGCGKLKNATIGNGVAHIGNRAFAGCDSLKSVIIGDAVTSIGSEAFEYCDAFTSVYYMGTATDWESITIGSSNATLTSATRYYYSETAPTEDGNFWHYDANGEIEVWP